MEVMDIEGMMVNPYDKRDKNVVHSGERFKVRTIGIPPQGSIPECVMTSSIIFYVISGSAEVTIDGEKRTIDAGHCLVSRPGTVSMRSETGVRILGIQVET